MREDKRQTQAEMAAEKDRPRPNRSFIERCQEWKENDGERTFQYLYTIASVAICLIIIGVLLTTIAFLPAYGEADNPTNNEVVQRYIERGVEETGALNIVAGMILDYRAFDTFGESCVLFVAVAAVLILLQGSLDSFDTLLHEMEEPRHSLILKNNAALLIPPIMIFGFYVIFNGHLGPGGGFAGGALLGAALILYASAYGTRRASRFFSFTTYRNIVFFSLLFYALAKGYSFFMGANHLASGIPLGSPGNILSAGLILPLNIAIGLIVASTMYVIYILFSKGEMP